MLLVVGGRDLIRAACTSAGKATVEALVKLGRLTEPLVDAVVAAGVPAAAVVAAGVPERAREALIKSVPVVKATLVLWPARASV